MNSDVKTNMLYSLGDSYLKILFSECEYPWQVLSKIKGFICDFIKTEPKGYSRFSDDVIVGEGVRMYTGVTVEGPAIIGANTEIRPGAFIRGSVIIGEGCVIGNSTEIKNSILLDYVQVPHYNYVGDSILGNKSHMGAGSICSNLRSDGRDVIIHASEDIRTGLRKVGAFLGDGADIGCGCVLNPGTVIGKNTRVYPLTMTRGVYGSDLIVKGTSKTVKQI